MGKSSKDKRDSYYRLAKESGYRARSAYKLLQLSTTFPLFPAPSSSPINVLDLCAAPGSWSQVLSHSLPAHSKILALDLQPMTPIPGVTCLQADITHPSTPPLVLSHFAGEKADLVVSDGAPDVTGLHDLDEYVQGALLVAALNLACCTLREGGTFVAKIFRGRDADVLFAQLRCLFTRVTCAKPRSSRGSSIEAFVVCEGYAPPAGWKVDLGRPMGVGVKKGDVKENTAPREEVDKLLPGVTRLKLVDETAEEGDMARYIAPFVACGDLSQYDSDATVRLEDLKGEMGESRDPVQPPTAPPYKTAIEMRRMMAGEKRVERE